MTEWMGEVLERYGQAVTVRSGGKTEMVQAFLQPVIQREEQIPSEITAIGWQDRRLWLYLGQQALDKQDAVEWNGWLFQVRSCRPYYIGERLSHYWAMLEPEREAVKCGS